MLTEGHPGIVITVVAGMRRLCFPHLSETGFQALGAQEQLSWTPGQLPWFYPEYAWVFWEMVCIFPTGAISTDEGGRCSKWSARRWKHGRRRSWLWVESSPRPVRAPAPLVYKHAPFRKGAVGDQRIVPAPPMAHAVRPTESAARPVKAEKGACRT